MAIRQVFKITYPTGKIYIGKDLLGRVDFFGNPNRRLLAKDFKRLPTLQRSDYHVRKEVLWESRDCSEEILAAKKLEFIRKYQSYQSNIGYNRSTNIVVDRRQSDTGYRIGVDGCKAGWFYVAALGESYEFGIVNTLAQLFDTYETIMEVIVDIPIGLFDNGTSPRACDIEARKYLSPRGSTVFPAPLRPCLSAEGYAEACTISKSLSGKSVSKQAYNIFNKIDEIDSLLRSDNKYRLTIKEAHPELGFCFLNNGRPLLTKKKDADGLSERLNLLTERLPFANEVYVRAQSTFLRKYLAKDDIVDALMCFAISIASKSDRKCLPENAEIDDFGIQMAMHYAKH
jgi:predicted RNase H-like nuclease